MLQSNATPFYEPKLVAWTRTCRPIVAGCTLLMLCGCHSMTNHSIDHNQPVNTKPLTIAVTKHSSSDESIDWTTLMQPLFKKARLLVEKNTGEDLSDVTLNITNDLLITEEVAYETERLIQNQFNDKKFVNHFLSSVMSGQQGTYAALYATRKNEVMVSLSLMQSYQTALPNDLIVQESAILALLIHELVHAADDKRYNIHDNRDLNFRASFAQSAAFEGHAQFVTRKICAKAQCLSGLEALDEFMFGRMNPPNQLTQPVQAISRNVLEYSYIEGERFITNLASRPNGQQLIGKLLNNPPQDPIQILDPQSYPDTQREQRNQQLMQANARLNHPWLSGSWSTVQTSPLKGVNLRTDPTRRIAAVDGFTRLITSMIALQLYDQAKPGFAPIELTVLRTDNEQTAKMFAETLHANTRLKDALLARPDATVKVATQSAAKPALLYMTKEPAENNLTYYTLVGVSGINVIQIAGYGNSESLFVEYIDQLLLELISTEDAPVARLTR